MTIPIFAIINNFWFFLSILNQSFFEQIFLHLKYFNDCKKNDFKILQTLTDPLSKKAQEIQNEKKIAKKIMVKVGYEKK